LTALPNPATLAPIWPRRRVQPHCAGSLLAYGADPRELCQRTAVFVRKILRGAKPGDLPIERPKFQLVVNLKTAEALGLTLPSPWLFQADEVIR
jgi:putative tryptophan/tyrosine transport system substrate-binding protein